MGGFRPDQRWRRGCHHPRPPRGTHPLPNAGACGWCAFSPGGFHRPIPPREPRPVSRAPARGWSHFAPRSPRITRTQRLLAMNHGERIPHRCFKTRGPWMFRYAARRPTLGGERLCVLVILGDLGANATGPTARAAGRWRKRPNPLSPKHIRVFTKTTGAGGERAYAPVACSSSHAERRCMRMVPFCTEITENNENTEVARHESWRADSAPVLQNAWRVDVPICRAMPPFLGASASVISFFSVISVQM
jgi:hypothetical protein